MASEIDRYSCDVCCRRELPEPDYECEQKTGEDTADGYAPFVDPGGDDEDNLPTIYETLDTDTSVDISGDLQRYTTGSTVATITFETLREATSFDAVEDANYNETTNQHDDDILSGGNLPDDEECISSSTSGGSWQYDLHPDFPGWSDAGTPDPECSATLHKHWTTYEDAQTGSAQSLQGCPGPFAGTLDVLYCDLIREDYDTEELSDGKTLAQTVSDAETARDAESWETGTCEAATVATWPTLGDLRDWPACSEDDMADGLETSGTVTASKLRMRWTLPAGWPGDYFRVDWDWLFTPADGTAPSILDSENWEYTGANSPSAWFEVEPTAGEIGTVTPVNVRFIGWSTVDAIPQYHGSFETYDP